MARRYYLSATSSLFSGGDFYKKLTQNIASSSSTTSFSITGAVTESSFSATEPLHPGTAGNVTGDYIVTVDVTTANANIFLSVFVSRIDSVGDIQTSSSTTAEQQMSTTGQKTFTLSAVNLGTFASTDQFRITYVARNVAKGVQVLSFATDDLDSSVLTPFTTRVFVVT